MDLESNTIEEMRNLPPEIKAKLVKDTLDRMYDRYWCKGNSIDYSNPDVYKAMEIIFKDKYQGKVPQITIPTDAELQLQ
jgi:hypothetical protein